MTRRHRDGIRFEHEVGESEIVTDALATEDGYRAQSLKRNQTTLSEFR